MAVSDVRAQMVLSELLDLDERSSYLSDLWTDMGSAMGRGETMHIPEIGALTVEDGGTSNLTVQAITNNKTELKVDQVKAISAELPDLDDIFTMQGGWTPAVAVQLAKKIRNEMDSKDFEHLAYTTAYDTDATYHVNEAGDALSDDDLENTIAAMLSESGGVEGADYGDLAWMFHPYGIGSVRRLSSWTKNVGPDDMGLGIRRVGFLHEIPVYVSQSVARNPTVAATASAVSSGEFTFTVAAGHGLVPGVKITATGGTENITTAVAIDSVTATTVVATSGSATDASNGAMTIATACCWNALVRRDFLFRRAIENWRMRVIPYGRTRTTDVIQVKRIWGRAARARGAYILHSPGSAVA